MSIERSIIGGPAGRRTVVFPGAAALIALSLVAGAPAAAQEWGEESVCGAVLASPAELPATLAAVPKYGTTYVLVYPERLAEQLLDLVPDVVSELDIVGYGDSSAAELAAEHLRRSIELLAFEPDEADRLVAAVLSGEHDAALLWAPLAGILVQELDLNYELSMRTVGTPSPPPAALAAADAAMDEPPPCADEIRGLLEGYGVIPAEKLVPLDIRELLHLEAPARDRAAADAGAALYAVHCARCHGPEAVAATDALAPVDLLISLPRFSYPGFVYIVLNGRSKNGMPGFKGSLESEQVDAIYQYVRERAHGTIRATAVPEPAAEPPAAEAAASDESRP